jgi:hypothetical protein
LLAGGDVLQMPTEDDVADELVAVLRAVEDRECGFD